MTDVISLSELSDEPGWREIMGDDWPDFSPRLRAVLNRLTSNGVHITNALVNAEILTLSDLRKRTREDLLRVKKLGAKSVEYIDAALARFGIGREEVTPPIIVRDGATAAEAHVQRLQRWIEERMAVCEANENKLDPATMRAAITEREVLADVMLIIDGREPTNKRRWS